MNALVAVNDPARLLSRMKKQYQPEARKFLDFCQIHGFSMETYTEFIEILDPIYSVSTVNKHIASCRALIRLMFDSPDLTELQKWSLQKGLDRIKYRKIAKGEKAVRPDQILSRDEIDRLVAESPERTGLLVRFLHATGLRISEACSVRLDRCKVNGTVAIRILGKGSKERTVRVSRDLFKAIRKVYGGKVYLFETRSGNPVHDRNAAKEIRRLGEKILHKPITPHQFRHTFATEKIRESGKVQAVSEYLGHSSPSTTLALYVHEILDDHDLGIDTDL